MQRSFWLPTLIAIGSRPNELLTHFANHRFGFRKRTEFSSSILLPRFRKRSRDKVTFRWYHGSRHVAKFAPRCILDPSATVPRARRLLGMSVHPRSAQNPSDAYRSLRALDSLR